MKNLFKNIKTKTQRGVSLIELVVYMAILSILLIILTAIFTQALDVQSESETVSAVQQDGNYILAKLAYDVRRADRINIPATNGEIGNSFQIVINGANYTYSIDANNNLVLANNSGANFLNNSGSSVTGLAVQRLGNMGGVEDTLKIDFTITSRNKRISGFEVRNFGTNLSLRRQ